MEQLRARMRLIFSTEYPFILNGFMNHENILPIKSYF